MDPDKNRPSSDPPPDSSADAEADAPMSDPPQSAGGSDEATNEEGAAPRRRRKRKRRPEGDSTAPQAKKRRKSRGGDAKTVDEPPRKRSRLVAAIVAGVVLLVVIGIVVTGRRGTQGGAEGAASDWSVGTKVPVEITLVAADKANLACASTNQVGGKHCAFESATKEWSKAGGNDEAALLKPYTTTDRKNLLAAGLWNQPALSGTLPSARFSVKCTFVVEGAISKPHVRWEAGGEWYPNNAEWHAGTVKDCSLVGAGAKK